MVRSYRDLVLWGENCQVVNLTDFRMKTLVPEIDAQQPDMFYICV